MTAQEWVRRFAEKLGVEPPDPATFDKLLELAGVAAHASERVAAPIACYLVGRAGMGADQAFELAGEVPPSR